MNPPATLEHREAEQASLLAADELFYNRGVAAVTMAQIRDRSGVSLRRLYSMYPSKSDLITAWLNHRHLRWMAGFQQLVEHRMTKGHDPIDATFAALETWMSTTDFRGCGFINTHAETSELTDEHRAVIRNHKRAVADYLLSLTPNGGALAVLVDGAIVQAAIFADPEPIRTAHRAARSMTTPPTQGPDT